jgi:hypothetical protein
MSTFAPPTYAVTGAGFWPAVGTVPRHQVASTYTVTQESATVFTLETNPVGGDLLPNSADPRVMQSAFLYIPSLAVGERLVEVSFVGPNFDAEYGVVGTKARIEFKKAPAGLVIGAATAVHVLEFVGIPCKVWNTGGATATVDGSNFIANQWTKMTYPFEYDATASTLGITLLNP